MESNLFPNRIPEILKDIEELRRILLILREQHDALKEDVRELRKQIGIESLPKAG